MTVISVIFGAQRLRSSKEKDWKNYKSLNYTGNSIIENTDKNIKELRRFSDLLLLKLKFSTVLVYFAVEAYVKKNPWTKKVDFA